MKHFKKIVTGTVTCALSCSMLLSVPVFAAEQGTTAHLDGDILYVRSGPGITNAWKGYLRENETVSIISQASDDEGTTWYEIEYQDGTAFVCGDFVDINSNGDNNENSTVNEYYETGTIINIDDGDILNVRNGAGIENDRLGALVNGEKVNITGTAYDSNGTIWYQIEFNNGIAFICGEYVGIGEEYNETQQPVSVDATTAYVINIDDGDVLNVRSGAGLSNSKIGYLNDGAEVTIIGTAADYSNTKWYEIEYNGGVGFVHSYYISEDVNPVTTPETYTEENTESIYTRSVSEQILYQALEYANDDSHGYRNVSGDNTGYGESGSFDCGGLVTRCLWDLGLLPTNKIYEPNAGLQWVLTNYGFEAIPFSYDNLQPGDILYQYGHTVIYAGDWTVVGAHGSMGNWEAGDQSGNEVSLTGFYGDWEYIFRYVG